jgi:hypothetical protein
VLIRRQAETPRQQGRRRHRTQKGPPVHHRFSFV